MWNDKKNNGPYAKWQTLLREGQHEQAAELSTKWLTGEKKPPAEAIEMMQKGDADGFYNLKSLNFTAVPLPNDVVHLSSEQCGFLASKSSRPSFAFLTVIGIMTYIAISITNGLTWQLALSLGLLFMGLDWIVFHSILRKSTTASAENVQDGQMLRGGLLLAPMQIGCLDAQINTLTHGQSDNQIAIRTDDMWLECDLIKRAITLKSGDRSQPETLLALSGIGNISAVSSAIEAWINQSRQQVISEEDALQQQRWLDVIDNLLNNQKLPSHLVDEIPSYPYQSQALATFTEKLRRHESQLQRKDRWVRYSTLSLFCIGLIGMISLTIFTPNPAPWLWAEVSFLALANLSHTHLSLRRHQRRRRSGLWASQLFLIVLMLTFVYWRTLSVL